MVMNRHIVLDIETTGLNPEQNHKVIEIYAMEIIDSVKTGKYFHHFINPLRNVPEEAFAVHGISTDFLKDKKIFQDIAQDFLDFLNGDTLIIHNAKFDVNFLNYELENFGFPLLNVDNVIDTLLIARKKFPGQPASLDALCKKFKISLDKRDKHGAEIDVELLYNVYLNLIEANLLLKTSKEENIKKQQILKKERVFKESRRFILNENQIEMHKNFIKAKIKNPLWTNYYEN